ncbi:glycosyltransferase N-terminal domain-containing protein [Tabrizicola sp.]|uniref:3-deoxy-D-manno-octulosonic acid transferase n=1 Tax=Tabrizicola sp. TaxID=2005166 RepID=UPI0026254639|nr:glycosyltransferase N-terminal domain-containing protein [Tabrizicola sp.]MDM7932015.1 glycosyltransferase N-terminal domain-containing protein [Tabrizicola sp.]
MAWALQAYLGAAHLADPLWRLALARRAKRGKEEPGRLTERLGHASMPRPDGPILWVHGLGIGEASAMLSIIRAIRAVRPDVAVILTTGTRTGAEGLARIGLPDGVIHQYAPVDAPGPVRRFLRHWRPDALLLAELDLWPLTLSRLHKRGIPVVMANARLTDHRYSGRQRIRALMCDVLGLIDMMLVQDVRTRERLISLGADPGRVRVAGLLKAAAEPLPEGEGRLAMERAIGARPVWLAAATEARELPVVLAAHAQARKTHQDLMLILAPRQLTDADAAASALEAAFGSCPRRSAGALPCPQDAVYLADTMGEMGLWYRLAPVSFIGHSLRVEGKPLTGKNPFEAASLRSAVIHGPCTGNFAESYAALAEAEACLFVSGGQDLAEALLDLIAMPERRKALVDAAAGVLDQARESLPLTLQAVLGCLPAATIR